jgi:uncharacterized protein (DUF302 family)
MKSPHSVEMTINKLEAALKAKNMTIFVRISHSDGAEKVGLSLPPTELLVFGNPKIGTLMMQCAPTTALDLPLKAMAYEDNTGQVWLTYNDPAWIANRHDITVCDEVVRKISAGMKRFTAAAVR